MGYDLALWLRRCQSGLCTADKSGTSPGENSHNIGWGTGSSTVAFEALLGLEGEAGPGSDSDSSNRLL